MSNLVHFLLGSVRIEAKGPFPERFLNLLGEEKIRFWEPRRLDEGRLRVCIAPFALGKSRALAQRALCELRVVGGTGLPSFLLGLRRRYALLAGLFCALFGAIVLSQFVLVIEVTGNERLSDSVILTELEAQGFGIGTYAPGVDRRGLANEVLLRLPELSFLSVNISGVRAEVLVREAEPEPELEDRWAAGDVVAATDGVVLSMDPVIGRAAVEEGQAVLAGELLISGTEEHPSGDGTGTVLSVTQVRAEGRVRALTRRELRCVTPLEVTAAEPTGERVTLPGLRLLRRSVKFRRESSFFPQSCGRIEEVWTPALPFGASAPLALTRKTLKPLRLRSAHVSRASAEKLLRQRLEERLRGLLGESGQVLGQELHFEEKNGALTGRLTASCVEDIAVQVPRTASDAGSEPGEIGAANP